LPDHRLDSTEGPRDGKLSFFVVSYSSPDETFEGSDATSAAGDLKLMYKIRKDLVHHAHGDLQTVNAHLKTLEIIAAELLRFRMKIAYEAQPLIEDAGFDRLS
jgi:hypothetical protein